jgi:ECF transporter S component (folate family)
LNKREKEDIFMQKNNTEKSCSDATKNCNNITKKHENTEKILVIIEKNDDITGKNIDNTEKFDDSTQKFSDSTAKHRNGTGKNHNSTEKMRQSSTKTLHSTDKMRQSTVKITFSAMLCAISIIIGIFCKNFLNFGGGLFRITFENLPIILSGVMYGPIVGGMVGVATDLISYFLSSQAYPPNLIVTAGALAVGVCSGIVSKFIVKSQGYKQIIFSGVFAHIVGSMIIKPIGLFQFYGLAVLMRIPLYLIIMPIEVTILCLLYKNSNFRKLWKM